MEGVVVTVLGRIDGKPVYSNTSLSGLYVLTHTPQSHSYMNITHGDTTKFDRCPDLVTRGTRVSVLRPSGRRVIKSKSLYSTPAGNHTTPYV